VARDEDGKSQGYAFVAYDSFESSDKAIENMNSQYLMNSQIRVSYAYKREGKGERHGNEAERRLAAQATRHNYTIQPLAPIVPLNDSAPPPVPSLPPGFGVGTNGKTAIPPPPAGF
jgi:splicing factor 3B subunit 4